MKHARLVVILSLALTGRALAAPASSPPAAPPDVPDAIRVAKHDVQMLTWPELTLGSLHGEKLAADASSCSATAGTLSGVYTIPDEPKLGVVHRVTIAAADIEPTICAPLAARAKTWDATREAKTEHDREAKQAPFRAAGITGDKLAFLARRGLPLYTAGQRLVSTPADAAKTSVFFILMGDDHEGYTLHRYAFEGGKLAETQRGFLVRPGRGSYR